MKANEAFDVYRELYYEGGVGSVYFWDLDDGFAGVVLLKKGPCSLPRATLILELFIYVANRSQPYHLAPNLQERGTASMSSRPQTGHERHTTSSLARSFYICRLATKV